MVSIRKCFITLIKTGYFYGSAQKLVFVISMWWQYVKYNIRIIFYIDDDIQLQSYGKCFSFIKGKRLSNIATEVIVLWISSYKCLEAYILQ